MTTEDSSTGCAASESTEKIEAMKTASDLLAQGKRNIVCGEIPKAVTLYEDAVQILVKSCGELSRDCADAYFCCGSALLELGRMETNVLGVALEGVEVEEEKEEENNEQFEKPPEDEGERQKLREEVYEAMAEGEREEELQKLQFKQSSCSVGCDKVAGENSEATAEQNSKVANDKEGASEGKQEKLNDLTKSVEITDNSKIGGEKEEAIVTNLEEKMDDSSEITRGSINDVSDKQGETDKKDTISELTEGNTFNDGVIKKEESACDEGKQDEKQQDIVVASVENTNENTVSDNKQDDLMDVSPSEDKQESINKDVEEKSKIDNSKELSAGDQNRQEESIQETAPITTENSSDAANKNTEKNVNVSAGDEGKAEKKMEDIPSTKVTEESVPVSTNQENTIAAENKEVLDESKQPEKKSEVTAEKASDATVIESCQTSEEGKCGNEQNGVAGTDSVVNLNSGAVSCVKADEEADVEMDDDEDDDDAEGEEVNEDDIPESEETEVNEKEEDVPNFQLAWEYLDLAKVLYLKSECGDDQLKAAECYIKLGELSMETEQHAVAAEDLENALKIRQKHLPANDRLIAETHYQLGLAYGLGGSYEQSIENYTKAVGVIESKIESLNQLVKEKGADGEDKENLEVDQLKKYQDEISELQDLIPEIKTKIEDIKQEAKEVEQIKHMAKEALGRAFPSVETESPAQTTETTPDSNGDDVDNGKEVASDITHLVRKKRKQDDDLAESEEIEVKKIRSDSDCPKEAVVGEEAVNGASGPVDCITGEGDSTVTPL